MSINKVILLGNLVSDPEVRVLNSGATVVSFCIATSKKAYTLTNGTHVPEQTEFHNCVVWGKYAEVAGKYFKKGIKLYVEGELKTNKWEHDGKKYSRTEIIVSNFEMCSKKDNASVEPEPDPFNNSPGTDDMPF